MKVYRIEKFDKKYIIQKLRIETGYGLMDCKFALDKNNYDIKLAKEWLIKYMRRMML